MFHCCSICTSLSSYRLILSDSRSGVPQVLRRKHRAISKWEPELNVSRQSNHTRPLHTRPLTPCYSEILIVSVCRYGTTCYLLIIDLIGKMLTEESRRAENFIITQMVKRTNCCGWVREWEEHMLFVGDNHAGFLFFFLLFSSAHWLLWSPLGWRRRRWRMGLWAPSEAPLLSH